MMWTDRVDFKGTVGHQSFKESVGIKIERSIPGLNSRASRNTTTLLLQL